LKGDRHRKEEHRMETGIGKKICIGKRQPLAETGTGRDNHKKETGSSSKR
jgi:hypothetical protein